MFVVGAKVKRQFKIEFDPRGNGGSKFVELIGTHTGEKF